ncbi:unnamed protein product [Rangifer tarandus platyrhynchus]|uniref:Uncharacterized protein n=2 Tax=Rangifer tarandus platyrhynchus TaxID=3082113 RepID=A0AC59YD13_RANTA|nr:unnamed protein product [Rangifer tarandus platyrhynchus]
MFHKLLYLQTFNFRKVNTKPKIRTKLCRLPSLQQQFLIIEQSPLAPGTNKCTCSYLRELLQLLSPLPCPRRISIICCFSIQSLSKVLHLSLEAALDLFLSCKQQCGLS